MKQRSSFFTELQRRNVLRAAAFYAASGWLAVQVATQVFPFFHIDEAVVRWIVIAAIVGLPFALVFAWLYELTPQGVVRESEIDRSASITANTGKKLDKAIIAVLVLAVILLLLNQFVLHRFIADSTAAVSGKSIAVLPFDNLSDDKSNAYFASGIQDEILTRLAGIADLKVISRTSTQQYASRPSNLKIVAAELGVATLLEGSVQKSGERVRVNVQLIDARSDTHLWASTYDRELKDAFAVESEVSQDIADQLKAKLSPNEIRALAGSPTQNAEAYDAFLKAEYEFNQALDSEIESQYSRAEAHYRQALSLDDGFALAHARYALCLLSRHWFVKPLGEAGMLEVRQHIDRALALAPTLADAHLSLGYLHFWGHRDYAPATAEFERVLQIEPNNSQAISALAFIHRRQGDATQAEAGLRKALSFAPRDNVIVAEYAATLMLLRRYPDAVPFFANSLVLDPDKMDARSFMVRNFLWGSGDNAAAQRVFDGLPADRMTPINNDDGDIINIVNARVYPLVFQRRYDEALQAWDAVTPASEAQRVEKLVARVAIQTLAGRQKIAQPECEQLRGVLEARIAQQPDDLWSLTALSWTYLCLGRNADAIGRARRASELLPLSKDAYSGNYFLNGLAQIDAHAGQPDEALKLIAQLLAAPAGDTMSRQRLKLDPVWDPLRGDARFQQILADAASP
jgi:TolB-like protein